MNDTALSTTPNTSTPTTAMGVLRPPVNSIRDHDAKEGQHRAGRQLDTGGDNHSGFGNGQNAEDGDLPHDDLDVVGGREVMVER